ncbi:hypothetical protein P0F65_03015 [Sphingomonas sp. I4]
MRTSSHLTALTLTLMASAPAFAQAGARYPRPDFDAAASRPRRHHLPGSCRRSRL